MKTSIKSALNWVVEFIAIALLIASIIVVIKVPPFTYFISHIAFILELILLNIYIDYLMLSSLAVDEKYLLGESK